MKHQRTRNLQLFATKLKEKIPAPINAKEYHQPYLKKKIGKMIKNNFSKTKETLLT